MKLKVRIFNLWRTTMSKAYKVIEYDKLLDNVIQMINLLEYDAMRGSGKCKLNAANLVDLYQLKDRYEAAMAPKTKTEEETPVKKGPGRPPKV